MPTTCEGCDHVSECEHGCVRDVKEGENTAKKQTKPHLAQKQ